MKTVSPPNLQQTSTTVLAPMHKRILASAIGGYFIDGYDLLVLAGALLAIRPEFHLTSLTLGLLTSSAFIGMALGSLIAGPWTDRWGRRLIFLVTMVTFLVASAALLWVDSFWQLVVIRFVIGFAIGADMPCSAALITEFMPGQKRGTYLALGGVAWMAGALISVLITLGIFSIWGAEAWRWALASGGIFSILLLIMRHRMPESPYWLYAKNRHEEAVDAWRQGTGERVSADQFDDTYHTDEERSSATTTGLPQKSILMMLLFMNIYWGLSNLYGSAFLLYQPMLLAKITSPTGYTSLMFSGITLTITVLIGIFVAYWLMDRVGRRSIALLSNIIMAFASAVIWLHISSLLVTVGAFTLFIGIGSGAASLIFYAWAPELFPTSIRGRAVGITNMVGKAGSVIGTLLLPGVIDFIGNDAFLLISAFALFNALIVYWLAPETRGKSLQQIQEDLHVRFNKP